MKETPDGTVGKVFKYTAEINKKCSSRSSSRKARRTGIVRNTVVTGHEHLCQADVIRLSLGKL